MRCGAATAIISPYQWELLTVRRRNVLMSQRRGAADAPIALNNLLMKMNSKKRFFQSNYLLFFKTWTKINKTLRECALPCDTWTNEIRHSDVTIHSFVFSVPCYNVAHSVHATDIAKLVTDAAPPPQRMVCSSTYGVASKAPCFLYMFYDALGPNLKYLFIIVLVSSNSSKCR